MKIIFTPMNRPDQLTLSRAGDTLTINGKAFDFSGITEGACMPSEAIDCDWLASDIERIDGMLHLTLILPHGDNAPHETRFPAPVVVFEDGPIPMPLYDAG